MVKAQLKGAPKAIKKQIATQYFFAILTGFIGFLALPSLASAVLFLISFLFFSLASRRLHGITLERRALKQLKLPDGWQITHSHPVPGLGDADLLISSPDGQRYVVEIKAHRKVSFSRPILGVGGGLRFMGAKPPKDPIKQALALGERLKAIPVVWFPEADTNRRYALSSPCPYFVVLGKSRHLKRAIGASNIFGF